MIWRLQALAKSEKPVVSFSLSSKVLGSRTDIVSPGLNTKSKNQEFWYLREEDGCLNSSRERENSPSVSLFVVFKSSVDGILVGRMVSFTESNANLLQEHSDRHTLKKCLIRYLDILSRWHTKLTIPMAYMYWIYYVPSTVCCLNLGLWSSGWSPGLWIQTAWFEILPVIFCQLLSWHHGQVTSLECSVQFSSVTQSCPTLQPHKLQHARPPCPSPTPGVYSNSCPSSQ